MTTEKPSIGFIGLGGMGRGLVKNLLKHGFSVRVFDIDADAMANAEALGAVPASSAADAARDVDIVSVCVTTAEAVQKIALGPDGVFAAMRADAEFVDHTTVSPSHVDAMRAAATDAGVAYAEAPMTRTPAHADRGEVNILFGGEADQLARLTPMFEAYAENVFHVGPAGHAIRLKLIHNYIAFANVATWCEGFALAARDGLDMSKVIGIISAAGGKSGMMDLYGELTLKRDFTPHMSLSNAAKDVRYYAEWIEASGLPDGLADAVFASYARAEETGHGSEGCTAIIKAYETISGVEARLPTAPDNSGSEAEAT